MVSSNVDCLQKKVFRSSTLSSSVVASMPSSISVGMVFDVFLLMRDLESLNHCLAEVLDELIFSMILFWCSDFALRM